ncbi:hypothetical protein RSAG8_10795, partial [Rhizoctonia solani AG-8 WAC10335]
MIDTGCLRVEALLVESQGGWSGSVRNLPLERHRCWRIQWSRYSISSNMPMSPGRFLRYDLQT